ncbi:helix-turn-helix domain-containing protein [Streptomyces inhibens]|uniref:helix-turn-helix domain-containing protein n=1 Tax=Streptomyces inhibens TaxID=2293571 RepID=UPI001EE7425B|nr:helix-turn-helix domain-containing protein [Streptomyces inhibens]UKY53536.1 helix-turn-helix domain-containing protein [Streptomyces inhibens]
MSDTTPDSTPTQNPTPEPLTGLTEAQAAIYTELVGRTEPATVIELALAAGIGKSTAGRALPLLEQSLPRICCTAAHRAGSAPGSPTRAPIRRSSWASSISLCGNTIWKIGSFGMLSQSTS